MTTTGVKINRVATLFDPLNLLLIFANLFAFVVMETLFFWYIASNTISEVVKSKSLFLANVANNDPDMKEEMITFLSLPENSTEISMRAASQNKVRNEKNVDMVISRIFPVAIAMAVACILMVGMIYHRGEKFTRVDYFLLLLVLLAFSTELIFYLVVIKQLEYIGTSKLVEILSVGMFPDLTDI